MPELDDCSLMKIALEEADKAARSGEVPIGAVLVMEGRIFQGHNRVITDADPTAHAEIVVMRQAALAAGNYRLPGARLYVTLEPCLMCAGAIVQARIALVVFGAWDERFGAFGSLLDARTLGLNHVPEVVSGVMADACRTKLQAFFQARR